MDDDLAITLGILLAVDEATARRIAENIGHTFGTTAGKGADKAFNASFKGGGTAAETAGAKAGKNYTKGFASQMRSLERLIKEAAKRATTAQRIEAETAAAQERSIMRSREKAFAASLQQQTARVKGSIRDQNTAILAASRVLVNDAQAAARQRVEATKTAAKLITDTNKAQQQRDTDSNRAALNNGTKVLTAALNTRLAATRAHLAQVVSATEHANRRMTNSAQAAARDASVRLDRGLARSNAGFRYSSQMRVDRAREAGLEDLSGVRRSNNEAENLYRTSNAKILNDAKRHNAAMIAADQQAGVRRTAYIRTALNNLTRVNQTVMTAILTAWRSHHQRRLADETSANRKAEIELQGSMDRRLARIKAGTRQQSLAATANATASERANATLSGGVLGAATGRGMGVASLFAGALGGREIFNILGEYQSIETAFKGIFREVDGGAPRTTQFLKDMQAFARETPFTLSQVSLAAQKMFANRIVDAQDIDATEQLTDKLRRLADAAAATGKNAAQMDMALLGITQIKGTGFMMEELRQVTENIGLPMEEVAKSLGMTVAEMRDAMKEGAIGAEEGLDAIFDALTRIPGAAGASARQAKTLRGAMSQLRDVGEQLVIKFLMPVGNAFAAAALTMGKFGDQLISGRGAWKVARDALSGIVAALTAIIAAKGAIQVVKLLGIGLSAIAAAPVTAALVALVGVLSTFDGLRAKLASLVEGTKNWFLVGYRANTVIDSFSGFVKVITTVGKFARTVQDFTKALVVGTKDWFLVGYRISGVIDEFSNIVLFQTSLGAAARVIKNALQGIWDALGILANTRDFGEFRKALGKVAGDALKELEPIRDAIAKQFLLGLSKAKEAASTALKSVMKYLGDNMDTIIAGARVASGGALILRILGLARGGNFAGAAKLGIAAALASALVGAAVSLSQDQTADEFAAQVNEFLEKAIDRAFDAAVIIAAVTAKLGGLVTSVWASLFGDDKGGGKAADPKASISIADKIAATIKAAWKKATSTLSDLSTLASEWFTETFTKWVVNFPYEVGKLLSSTLLEDEVVKAIGTIAAGVVGVAAVLGGKFVQGLIAGIWESIPDLFRMMKEGFGGALGGDIGTAFAGSILLGMGAVFAGGKLATLAAKVAAPFRKFSIGFNADSTRDARIGIAGLQRDMDGTGSKAADLGMKVARISDAAGKATSGLASLTERAGRKMQELGAQAAGVQGKFQSAGGAIIQAGKSTNAATFVGFGGAGSNMEKFREAVGRAIVAVGGRLERLPEQIRTVAAKVRKGWDAIGGGAGAASIAVGAATAAMTGYFAAMADDTATQVTGYLATIAGITTAWALNGPIVGAVAAGAALIGIYFGNAAKQAKKEAAFLKEFEDAAKRAGDTYAGALGEFGTSDQGRMAASWKVINTAIEDTDGKLQGISSAFGVTFGDVASAVAGGKQAILDFRDGVIEANVSGLMDRDSEALARFGDTYGKVVGLSGALLDPSRLGLRQVGEGALEARAEFTKLSGALLDNEISINEWAEGAKALGADAARVDAQVERFRKGLAAGVGRQSGFDAYFSGLAIEIDKAIEKNRVLAAVQAQMAAAQERLLTPMEQFVNAWERVKGAIDDAATAFRSYMDQVLGRQLTLDETTLAVIGSAKEAVRARAEGESTAEFDASTGRASAQARLDLENASATFAKESGSVEEAISKTLSYIDSIIAGVDDPALKAFFEGMKGDPTLLNGIVAAFNAQNPIDDVGELRQRYRDLLQLVANQPLLKSISDNPTAAAAKQDIINSLKELEKQSPELQAYIEKAGGGDKAKGYEAVYQEIISDAEYLATLNPTVTIHVNAVIGQQAQQVLNLLGQSVLDLTAIGVKSNYNGGLETSPVLSTLAERGAEAIFPLTNPARMRQIMGIPQVARAFDAAGFGAPIAGNSTGTNYAPVTVDQSQVNHFTIASDTPRATADQIVRRQRSARFLGGLTLPVVIR